MGRPFKAQKEPAAPRAKVFGNKLPEELIHDLLRVVRTSFYPDRDKAFFQERKILLKALTYPAYFLERRGGLPTAERYQEIMLQNIILPIKRHGQLDKIGYFCRYFYHCVQQHMAKHWEEYYAQAKKLQRQMDDVLHGLSRLPVEAAPTSGISTLAELHQSISLKSGRKKKAASPQPADPQGSLF